jgi:hypothetical protein
MRQDPYDWIFTDPALLKPLATAGVPWRQRRVVVWFYTILSHDGLIRLAPPPRFVTVRGGGYFFLAGRSLIGWLASPRAEARPAVPHGSGTQREVTSL